MKFILTYLVVMNLLGFIFMAFDKRKAIHHDFRIPEKVLLGLAAFGAGLGCWLGMITFHHKKNKMIFKLGIPILFISNIFIFLYILTIIKG